MPETRKPTATAERQRLLRLLFDPQTSAPGREPVERQAAERGGGSGAAVAPLDAARQALA